MTKQEQKEIVKELETLNIGIKKLARRMWNSAVLECEDAAIRRYEEASEDDFLPGDAFDEAMEAVREMKL